MDTSKNGLIFDYDLAIYTFFFIFFLGFYQVILPFFFFVFLI